VLIILDFDGTLVESVDVKTEAFREVFGPYRAALDRIMAYHLAHNGIPRDVKFQHIYERILGIPYDAARREATARRFSELVFDRVVACPFVPGAAAFLERFAGRLPLYVVSASPESELRRVVVDKYVHIPPGIEIGYNIEEDRRRFSVTESGIVVVGKGTVIGEPRPAVSLVGT